MNIYLIWITFSCSFFPRVHRYECRFIKSIPASIKELTGITLSNINNFNYAASLAVRDNSYEVYKGFISHPRYCGATIIGAKWVISESSCYTDVSYMTVYIGRKVIFKGWAHEVLKAYLMPNYNERRGRLYPYMLLELKKKVYLYDKSVFAVNLDERGSTHIVSGKAGLVTGFEDQQFGKLHTIELPLITHNTCISTYPELAHIIHPYDFCAGFRDHVEYCERDQGIPFVVNNTLIGISRSMGGCSEMPRPGIFSSISFARDWMLKVMNCSNKILYYS